jgi:hypothetical protein
VRIADSVQLRRESASKSRTKVLEHTAVSRYVSSPWIYPFSYLNIEIQTGVPWQVETLNETVAAEIAALPADMQARFLRLAERIGQAGLQSLGEPR